MGSGLGDIVNVRPHSVDKLGRDAIQTVSGPGVFGYLVQNF